CAGRLDRAFSLANEVLKKQNELLGPTHPDTINAMHQLALIDLDAGLFNESIVLHEKVQKLSAVAKRPNFWAMNSYARALQTAGRLEDADAQLRFVLEENRRVSDPIARKNGIAITQRILGLNLLLQGRYAEAEVLARDVLAYLEKQGKFDDWALYFS